MSLIYTIHGKCLQIFVRIWVIGMMYFMEQIGMCLSYNLVQYIWMLSNLI